MIIYRITNKVNGKVYIGQTSRTLAERLYEHIKGNPSRVGKDIAKLGKDSFSIDVIDVVDTQEKADKTERFWIDFYSDNSYNVLSGGKPTKAEMAMLTHIPRKKKPKKEKPKVEKVRRAEAYTVKRTKVKTTLTVEKVKRNVRGEAIEREEQRINQLFKSLHGDYGI